MKWLSCATAVEAQQSLSHACHFTPCSPVVHVQAWSSGSWQPRYDISEVSGRIDQACSAGIACMACLSSLAILSHWYGCLWLHWQCSIYIVIDPRACGLWSSRTGQTISAEPCLQERPTRGHNRDIAATDCPAEAAELIYACIARNPADRPTAKGELTALQNSIEMCVACTRLPTCLAHL